MPHPQNPGQVLIALCVDVVRVQEEVDRKLVEAANLVAVDMGTGERIARVHIKIVERNVPEVISTKRCVRRALPSCAAPNSSLAQSSSSFASDNAALRHKDIVRAINPRRPPGRCAVQTAQCLSTSSESVCESIQSYWLCGVAHAQFVAWRVRGRRLPSPALASRTGWDLVRRSFASRLIFPLSLMSLSRGNGVLAATPAPRINTRAAFTVPAAVISIRMKRGYWSAASSTAL
ncbi:hypothetical protein QFZ89_001623 [Paraburkholderia youngii]